MQWKLPPKLSSFIQRAGRAARGPNRTGIAVLLVEPSAYSINTAPPIEAPTTSNPQDGAAIIQRGRGAKGRKGGHCIKKAQTPKARVSKQCAEQHGRQRGGKDASKDQVPVHEGGQPAVHIQKDTEGIHAFVQTGACRRKVIAEVFNNPAPCKFQDQFQERPFKLFAHRSYRTVL